MQFPVDLAVAQTARDVPSGAYAYEPKFDGWRSAVHVARGRLQSRNGTDLTRRFPEIASAATALDEDVVLDGELVAVLSDGAAHRLDFAALQAGPQRRRNRGVSVYFLVFDLIAQHGTDLRAKPYEQRRARLLELFSTPGGQVQCVPATRDRQAALKWLAPELGTVGIEGVVSKSLVGTYRGRRSGWWKTRVTTTEEAVVLGVTRDAVVLGRPDRRGRWQAVGLSQPLPHQLRSALASRLRAAGEPTTAPGLIAGLPGTDDVRYQPAEPELVVEIATDSAVEFGRYRHRPAVVRLRDDLAAEALQPLANR